MHPALKSLSDKLAALNQRERLMAVGALLAAVVYLGDAWLITPAQARAKALESELASETEQLRLLQEAVAKMKASRTPEALAIEHARLHDLREEVDFAQGVLRQAANTNDAARLARTVIAKSQGLTLRSLAINQPQVFFTPAAPRKTAGPAPTTPATPAEPLPRLYLHGVSFSVEGTYAQLVGLLQQLQAPGRYYWPEVVLTVTQYPLVNLKATVQTLSINEQAPLQ